MKPHQLLFTTFVIAMGLSTGLAEDGINDLKIGDKAPDFSLVGIDDQKHSLKEYEGAKVLMIAFLSNHCPTSHGAEERMKQLIADTKDKGFTFVAINPNHPDGLSIDELGYSKYNDGFDDMKKHAEESGFNFPYLYDGDTQEVAKAYGCLATPHVFIFDSEQKLQYKGRFDDSRFADNATVNSHDARNAVEALLEGKPVTVPITNAHGCSTKWLSKKKDVTQKMKAWDETPVDVAPIDTATVTKLRENGTDNIRLFNVWATWCVPCVQEFPDLVTTARKFDMRNFEFISISLDEMKDSAKVKSFLEKNGAGLSDRLKNSVKAEGRPTNSYIFEGANPDELMKALDPEWKGGVPHTILVDTEGNVIWRHNGQISADELQSAVLDHIGAVYVP